MSLLCFFLVAQLFPTQAASHSQQLAEGGPPLKAETFCWSSEVVTMVQLDQIASMAGKTQCAISSIYFLVQLAGLGINRLHSGAVHLFITFLLALREAQFHQVVFPPRYGQAQCMPAAAFRKQIWWKELGHKFAMEIALACSYMHLLLTSFVKPCRVCNHSKSRCKDDTDWYGIDLGSYNCRYRIYLDVITFQGPAISPFFYMGGDSTKMVCKELNGWRRVMPVSEYHSCTVSLQSFVLLENDWATFCLGPAWRITNYDYKW